MWLGRRPEISFSLLLSVEQICVVCSTLLWPWSCASAQMRRRLSFFKTKIVWCEKGWICGKLRPFPYWVRWMAPQTLNDWEVLGQTIWQQRWRVKFKTSTGIAKIKDFRLNLDLQDLTCYIIVFMSYNAAEVHILLLWRNLAVVDYEVLTSQKNLFMFLSVYEDYHMNVFWREMGWLVWESLISVKSWVFQQDMIKTNS